MRWPLVTRARYERELEIKDKAAYVAIMQEYQRAMKDGKRQVHAWARDAAAKFFSIDPYRAKGAAIAAFQQAEHQFNPAPLTLSEGLTKPANVEEAIDATSGTGRTVTLGVSAPGRDASGRGHIRPV